MHEVCWGMIGCGDVAEKKSGPAFSTIPGSRLLAVMRRDGAKAADYARRHQVDKWYTDADLLINNPEINAVYIATPPGSHLEFALKVAAAGKSCYVEKPMARNFDETQTMVSAFEEKGIPLFVAYYRRALPRFRMVDSLIKNETIGKILEIHYQQSNSANLQMGPGALPWRFQPEISGGGLFVDLGSHTLDLLDYWFGSLEVVSRAIAKNETHSAIEDRVSMIFRTQQGIPGKAFWNFVAEDSHDLLKITGSEGILTFSIFGHEPLRLALRGKDVLEIPFDVPQYIQQPLIGEIVKSLLTGSPCCSTGLTASVTNRVMDHVLAG